MRKVVISLFLFVLSASAEIGTITKWDIEAYSQSAHIIRNRVVYQVTTDAGTYQITRDRDKATMQVGQQINFKIEKGQMVIADGKGKETKYSIIGKSSK